MRSRIVAVHMRRTRERRRGHALFGRTLEEGVQHRGPSLVERERVAEHFTGHARAVIQEEAHERHAVVLVSVAARHDVAERARGAVRLVRIGARVEQPRRDRALFG